MDEEKIQTTEIIIQIEDIMNILNLKETVLRLQKRVQLAEKQLILADKKYSSLVLENKMLRQQKKID